MTKNHYTIPGKIVFVGGNIRLKYKKARKNWTSGLTTISCN